MAALFQAEGDLLQVERAAPAGAPAGHDRPAAPQSLIDDLMAATGETSPERRVAMLRQITDCFLGGANKLTQEQVGVFGDVLTHLTQRVESQVLAELGARLAPIDNAPRAVIQNLARHEEIAVAGPVLAHSTQLTDGDLVEIAKTRGQEHLGAISERRRVAAAVTDILVERGDTTVVRKLSRNQGASFSPTGFNRLAHRATNDGDLAESLTQRIDMPADVMQALISQATEEVRARLVELTPTEGHAAISQALAAASKQLLRETAPVRDFTRAEAAIAKLHKSEQLNEDAILSFAKLGQREEVVVGLAQMCAAPIKLVDHLMSQQRHDGILIVCKAAGLHWPTFAAILTFRFPHHPTSVSDIARARTDFLKLSMATARRAFHFWIIRDAVKA